MKSSMTAIAIALAASAGLATAAEAQREGGYGYQPPPPPKIPQRVQQQNTDEKQTTKQTATVTIGDRKVPISIEFATAFQELKNAVDAKDMATASAKLPPAQAAAKSPEERYLVSQLQLRIGSETNSDAQMLAALESMLATGVATREQLPIIHMSIGKARFNMKQYDQAAAAFRSVLQIDPANAEAKSLLERTQLIGASPSEALAVLQKQIAERSAAGAKAPANLYAQAIKIAYDAKLPLSVQLSREWVGAYPTAQNWSDALRIYRNLSDLDDAGILDVLRLSRTAGALRDSHDYEQYAYLALKKGYPGEAKTVIQEGVAAGIVDTARTPFKELSAEANSKSAGEAATLEEAAKSGLSSADARRALTTGDLLYGYGNYAKAAELYRAALGKQGADKDLINLHLGMALARAGDKAGATAALNAVGGAHAQLAKYWLVYVNTGA